MRRTRILSVSGGIASVVCVLAVLSIHVSAAAGASHFIASTESSASISGEGEVLFDFGSLSASCETANYEGTLEEPSETLTLSPSYSNCSAFGFKTASVNAEECELLLHGGDELGEEGKEFAGTLDISCPSENSVKVVASTCALEIPAQEALATLEFVNDAESESVTMTAGLEALEYTVTLDGFLCPLSGTGEFEDGGATGTTVLEAVDEAGPVGLVVAQVAVFPRPFEISQAEGARGGIVKFLQTGTYMVESQELNEEGFKLQEKATESCPIKVSGPKACRFEIVLEGAGEGEEATLVTKWSRYEGGKKVLALPISTKILVIK